MIPGLDINLTDLTPWPLLVLCFLAIVFGWLVPVRYYKQLERQLAHERATAETQRATILTLTASLEKLTDTSLTVDSVIGALQKNARQAP